VNITKSDKAQIEDIIASIYTGVSMQLDPTSNTYKEITNKLASNLLELRAALGMVK